MKKLLTLAFVLAALTVLASFGLAQERREAKSEPARPEQPQLMTLRCCEAGKPAQIDISTGQSGPIDPLWTVNGAAAYTTPLVPGWASNLSPAKWIQPVASPLPAYGVAVGVFKYSVHFVVPKCGKLSQVRIDGRFAADNGAKVTLDGNPVTTCPTPYCFKAPGQPLTITGIGVGPHTLTFEVNNEGGPSGLSVNAKLTRNCHIAASTDYATQKECEDDIKAPCKLYAGAGWHAAT
jgi:hypothetical protein